MDIVVIKHFPTCINNCDWLGAYGQPVNFLETGISFMVDIDFFFKRQWYIIVSLLYEICERNIRMLETQVCRNLYKLKIVGSNCMSCVEV